MSSTPIRCPRCEGYPRMVHAERGRRTYRCGTAHCKHIFHTLEVLDVEFHPPATTRVLHSLLARMACEHARLVLRAKGYLR